MHRRIETSRRPAGHPVTQAPVDLRTRGERLSSTPPRFLSRTMRRTGPSLLFRGRVLTTNQEFEQTPWTFRQPTAPAQTLSQRCHSSVRVRRDEGDGLRRFLLVRSVRESLRDNQIQHLSDWGSSGRRFKSCQPDAGQRVFFERLYSRNLLPYPNAVPKPAFGDRRSANFQASLFRSTAASISLSIDELRREAGRQNQRGRYGSRGTNDRTSAFRRTAHLS